MNNPSGSTTSIIVLCLVALIYFVPALAAYQRRHRNKDPIFIINLFLGWTFLGWVIALAWAFTDYVHPKPARRGEMTLRQEVSRRDPHL
jgi:hypothetical protein